MNNKQLLEFVKERKVDNSNTGRGGSLWYTMLRRKTNQCHYRRRIFDGIHYYTTHLTAAGDASINQWMSHQTCISWHKEGARIFRHSEIAPSNLGWHKTMIVLTYSKLHYKELLNTGIGARGTKIYEVRGFLIMTKAKVLNRKFGFWPVRRLFFIFIMLLAVPLLGTD